MLSRAPVSPSKPSPFWWLSQFNFSEPNKCPGRRTKCNGRSNLTAELSFLPVPDPSGSSAKSRNNLSKGLYFFNEFSAASGFVFLSFRLFGLSNNSIPIPLLSGNLPRLFVVRELYAQTLQLTVLNKVFPPKPPKSVVVSRL